MRPGNDECSKIPKPKATILPAAPVDSDAYRATHLAVVHLSLDHDSLDASLGERFSGACAGWASSDHSNPQLAVELLAVLHSARTHSTLLHVTYSAGCDACATDASGGCAAGY